jgi:hypothetical protein
MIRVLEITKHGKCSEISKLIGKPIECPECKCLSSCIHFDVEKKTENRFAITCRQCGCKFLIEIEGEENV